jgi:hypothetical protein
VKRGGHRGIHPGAVVAVDLLLWLGWAVVTFPFGAGFLVLRTRYLVDSRYPYDDDDAALSAADLALAKQVQAKGRALFAFACMTM